MNALEIVRLDFYYCDKSRITTYRAFLCIDREAPSFTLDYSARMYPHPSRPFIYLPILEECILPIDVLCRAMNDTVPAREFSLVRCRSEVRCHDGIPLPVTAFFECPSYLPFSNVPPQKLESRATADASSSLLARACILYTPTSTL
jgi:hypothetical protein